LHIVAFFLISVNSGKTLQGHPFDWRGPNILNALASWRLDGAVEMDEAYIGGEKRGTGEHMVQEAWNRIELRATPWSPARLCNSRDTRILGVALDRICLIQAK
jgi:hypothetical protein